MYGETLLPYPDNIGHTQIAKLVQDQGLIVVVANFIHVWFDTSNIPGIGRLQNLH